MADWYKIDDWLKFILPIILVLLIIYFYLSFFAKSYPDNSKILLELVIICYFGFELIVKFKLADNFKMFLSNHWLKIILILPFLRIFRVFGVIGQALRYIRYLPYLQKLAKMPKMLKVSKFVALLVMFKLSIINDREKVEKEKKKIKKKGKKDDKKEDKKTDK